MAAIVCQCPRTENKKRGCDVVHCMWRPQKKKNDQVRDQLYVLVRSGLSRFRQNADLKFTPPDLEPTRKHDFFRAPGLAIAQALFRMQEAT